MKWMLLLIVFVVPALAASSDVDKVAACARHRTVCLNPAGHVMVCALKVPAYDFVSRDLTEACDAILRGEDDRKAAAVAAERANVDGKIILDTK